MQTDSFRSWLQPRGLSPSTINTYISDAKRVERDYGDPDELYAKNRALLHNSNHLADFGLCM